ncbi:Bifunctional dethiobiotin synthetase/7-8-diamino-pelargonic acid aminotransferase [Nymphaea thermarum]|nr:Bifunctional dethiobiotin synthetase/7-8-diamino-pelargonic acid aminotransferase [Nymphaea thermarum]
MSTSEIIFPGCTPLEKDKTECFVVILLGLTSIGHRHEEMPWLLMALLHGHSYSAHALGCTAAVKAIQWFKDPHTNPNIVPQKMLLRELWDSELVHQLSAKSPVKRVIALGTLCAIELNSESNDSGARFCDLLVFFVVIPRDPCHYLGFCAVASGSVHAIASGSTPPRVCVVALVLLASPSPVSSVPLTCFPKKKEDMRA